MTEEEIMIQNILMNIEIEIKTKVMIIEIMTKKEREKDLMRQTLKNIIEKILLPYQFDAINLVERGLNKIVISKEAVEGNPAIMIFDKKIKNEQK